MGNHAVSTRNPLLALHGGAGVISRSSFDPEREARYRDELRQILEAGSTMLEQGADAVTVVEATICLLEDCAYFNAGRGSVLNGDGAVEMDAAIMDDQRACGSVAAVTTPQNPIRAARCVMDQTDHVMLVGPAADQFAKEQNLSTRDPAYFVTEERLAQLDAARSAGRISLDHDEQYGTVGAVALDQSGAMAAGSSTGGMTNKLPGRVGDTPIVGAGIWADQDTCAVSATGHGEFFIRAALSHDVHARMKYAGASLEAACDAALNQVAALGGSGGCIAVAPGRIALRCNSPGMYRAWMDESGSRHVRIYADE